MKRLAITLAMLATTASAQTTTCLVNGQMVNCNTAPSAPRSTMPNDYTLSNPALDNAQKEAAPQAAPDRNQRVRMAVGAKLLAGDCAGAEHLALQAGEIELADRVKARCK